MLRAQVRGASPGSLTRGLDSRGGPWGLAVDIAFFAGLVWVFDAINDLAPVRQRLAERNGRGVLSVEHALGIAPEHALNTWLASRATLSQIVVLWYENVHIAVTLAALGLVWWRRPDILRSSQLTLLVVNVLALGSFWALPVAPPRMLPGYVDLVALTQHLPPWRPGAVALHSNQLCSMPSLHMAWAIWSSIVLWQVTERRWLRALALAYPLATAFAVMATANHYLADVLVGAALTLLVSSAQRGRRSTGGAGYSRAMADMNR